MTGVLSDIWKAFSFSLHPFTHPIRAYEIREAVAVVGVVFTLPAVLLPVVRTSTDYGDVAIAVFAAGVGLFGFGVIGYNADLYIQYLRNKKLAVGMSVFDLLFASVVGGTLFFLERTIVEQFDIASDTALSTTLTSVAGFGIGFLGVLVWHRRQYFEAEIRPHTAQTESRLDCRTGVVTRTKPITDRLLSIFVGRNQTRSSSPRQIGEIDKYSYTRFEDYRWVWTDDLIEAVQDQTSAVGSALIEGPAGSGKSSFLHYLSYQSIDSTQVFFFHMGQDLREEDADTDSFLTAVEQHALSGAIVILDDIHRAPVEAEKLVNGLIDISPNLQIVMGTRLHFPSYRREARGRLMEQAEIPEPILTTFYTERGEGDTDTTRSTKTGAGDETTDDATSGSGQDFESVSPLAISEYQQDSLYELIDARVEQGELVIQGGLSAETGFKRQFSLYFSSHSSLVLADRVLDQLTAQDEPLEPRHNVWDFRRRSEERLQNELEDFWNQYTTLPDESAEQHANRFQSLILVWTVWGHFESPVNTGVVADTLGLETEETETLLSELQFSHLVVQSGEEEKEFLYKSTHHPTYCKLLLSTIVTDETRPEWFHDATIDQVEDAFTTGRPIQVFHDNVPSFSITPLGEIAGSTYSAVRQIGERVAERGPGSVRHNRGFDLLDSLHLLAKAYQEETQGGVDNSEHSRLSHTLWPVFAIGALNLEHNLAEAVSPDFPYQNLIEKSIADYVTIAEGNGDAPGILVHGMGALTFSSTLKPLFDQAPMELREAFVGQLIDLAISREEDEFVIAFVEVLNSAQRTADLWFAAKPADREKFVEWYLESLQKENTYHQYLAFKTLRNPALYALLWNISDDRGLLQSDHPLSSWDGKDEIWDTEQASPPEVGTSLIQALESDTKGLQILALDQIGYQHIFDSLRSLNSNHINSLLREKVMQGVHEEDSEYWYRSAEFLGSNFGFCWSAWNSDERATVADIIITRLYREPRVAGPAVLVLRNREAFEAILDESDNGIEAIGSAIITNLDREVGRLRRDSWRLVNTGNYFFRFWEAIDEDTKADFGNAILEVLQSPYGTSQNIILDIFDEDVEALRAVLSFIDGDQERLFKDSLRNILSSPIGARKKVASLFRDPDCFGILVGEDNLFSEAEFGSMVYESLLSQYSKPDILYIFCRSDQFFDLVRYITTRDMPDASDTITDFWSLPTQFDCYRRAMPERARQELLDQMLQAISYPDLGTRADLYRTLTHPTIFEAILSDAEPHQIERLTHELIDLYMDDERHRMVAFEMLTPELNFERIWDEISERQQRLILENTFQELDGAAEVIMRNLALTNTTFFTTVRKSECVENSHLVEQLFRNITEGGGAVRDSGLGVLTRCSNIDWLWEQWNDEQRRAVVSVMDDAAREASPDSLGGHIISTLSELECVQTRVEPYREH